MNSEFSFIQFFTAKTVICITLLLLCETTNAQKVYQEKDGIVMMEAEHTLSPLELWTISTNFSEYSGTGHLEFTGNTPDGKGISKSPLSYTFKIDNAGDYRLFIRGRSRLLDEERNDLCNDAWIRLEGDFELGTDGPQALDWLTNETKLFVGRGGNGDWGWGHKLDRKHVQPEAIYKFKKGDVYTLYISGRSTRFNIDRIVFVKTDADLNKAHTINTEYSWYDDGVTFERYHYEAINHFITTPSEGTSFYKDKRRNALAVDASNSSNRNDFASAFTLFSGKNGIYDITLKTMAEMDGESSYRLLVNSQLIGTYTNLPVTEEDDFQSQQVTFKNITLNSNDTIQVEAKPHSNSLIPEGEGYAWARGRWQNIVLRKSLYQGRLAVVADGNYRDSDDVGATPVSLAILSTLGLTDKLVYYAHSCDLKKGEKDPGGLFREQEMQTSCDGTAALWGGYDHISFFNCMQNKSAAIKALTEQINAAEHTNPLWIIEAGEPDIIWEAVNSSAMEKREFIYIVTHHPANDRGDEHDLNDVISLGIPVTNIHEIPDQNRLLKKSLADWYWAQDHTNRKINWLWKRGFHAQTVEMKYPPITGFFDVSDAGMIYYWATLLQGGDTECDVPKLKKLLLKL